MFSWPDLDRRRFMLAPDEIKRYLYALGEIAWEDKNFYHALLAFMELNDKDRVKEVGDRCLREGWFEDARNAFSFLGDKTGLLRVIRENENDPSASLTVENALSEYVGAEQLKMLDEVFKSWAFGKGISVSDANASFKLLIVNAAYHLTGKYEVGVGVSHGGLFSAYACSLFGLPVKVADCHKKGRGTSFVWVDKPNRVDLEGKVVAVFDNDVVSGRTATRVLNEVKMYDPARVDLVLVHSPVIWGGFGTVAANIPEGYNNTCYLKEYSYADFDKVAVKLEELLRQRHF